MSWKLWALALVLCPAAALRAQTACPPTPTYSRCEIVFELNDAESQAHPNPYVSVQIHAEFRSPRHKTFLLPAFWDGGRRMVIRFTPMDAGDWDYRISGNIERFAGGTGKLTATASNAAGFIKPANVHHFTYSEEMKPHLWMGDTCYPFALLEMPVFKQLIDRRAAQKFNHIRGLVLGSADQAAKVFPSPDQIDVAHFRALDERIAYMNSKEIVADLVLGGPRNELTRLFPTWQARERFVRYLVSRYSAYNITWQGVQEFEGYDNGRDLLKEIGLLLKKLDPYQHPRSTHTTSTSAPLLSDGWMDYVVYNSADRALGAIEHQLNGAPQVNTGLGVEGELSADEFRRRLWDSTMNGEYVTFANAGSMGAKGAVDSNSFDSPAAKQMTAWYDIMSRTRWWDLQPFFDVDGGRALALETIEYFVYLDKPGPVEVLVEKHGYDVYWINPLNGEFVHEKKDFKGEKFSGEPPDNTHDWILHLSRDGKKEGMAKSYKFEARHVILQEVEQTPAKAPYEIEEPAGDDVSASKPGPFAAKIKRETRATRAMMWLWTGEVAADGQGYRVLGTGAKGTLAIPKGLALNYPAVLSLRLTAMNGVGKVYSVDKILRLTQ